MTTLAERMRGTPWRHPDEESIDLYPGLVVHDGRVSGSITVGQSRLPLWAFAGWDWDEVVKSWDYIETDYGWTERDHAWFLKCLLEMRGEFGRLLLVLADAERCEQQRGGWNRPWWETKRHRKRVGDQLRRCLAALEADLIPASEIDEAPAVQGEGSDQQTTDSEGE